MSPELLAEVQPIAARVSRTVGGQFSGYIEVEDLQQELLIWTMDHEEQVRRYLEPEDEDDDSRVGRRKLHTTFRRVARGVAQRAKADRLGYSIDDLYFYSIASLAEILPTALAGTEEWVDELSGAATDPSGTPSRNDPAEGNNRLALLCDVEAAYQQGSEDDRRLLLLRFRAGMDIPVLAVEYSLSESAMRRRVDRALGRLLDRLGGARPDFGVKPGRKAMSNEQAQRLTREQE